SVVRDEMRYRDFVCGGGRCEFLYLKTFVMAMSQTLNHVVMAMVSNQSCAGVCSCVFRV
ncbi:unnamed protein product, partial [Trichobilharzia szidati]